MSKMLFDTMKSHPSWIWFAGAMVLCGLVCLPCSADMSRGTHSSPSTTFALASGTPHTDIRQNGMLSNWTPPDGMIPNWTPPDGNWTLHREMIPNWTPSDGNDTPGHGMPNCTPPDGNWTPHRGMIPNWTPSDGAAFNRTPSQDIMSNWTSPDGNWTSHRGMMPNWTRPDGTPV
jgi:hypothetical protein